MRNNHKKLSFALMPIIPHILFIAIALASYYFIMHKGLFPEWHKTIYYGIKIFIGFEIIIASARSILMPLIGILLALILVFSIEIYHINLAVLTSSDGWQLLIVSIIGLLVSALMQL